MDEFCDFIFYQGNAMIFNFIEPIWNIFNFFLVFFKDF